MVGTTSSRSATSSPIWWSSLPQQGQALSSRLDAERREGAKHLEFFGRVSAQVNLGTLEGGVADHKADFPAAIDRIGALVAAGKLVYDEGIAMGYDAAP